MRKQVFAPVCLPVRCKGDTPNELFYEVVVQ